MRPLDTLSRPWYNVATICSYIFEKVERDARGWSP
jgi:hypothetical protein